MKTFSLLPNVIAATYAVFLFSPPAQAESAYHPDIPKTWDETALANWPTPLAGLNQRPTHISSKEYYSLPVDNLRTYPVYAPGKEPPGYWDMLQHIGPKPMLETEKLRSEADWVDAGRIVFHEADDIQLRTLDPKLIDAARHDKDIPPGAGEINPGLRWVPTRQGVALTLANCSSCHLLLTKEGKLIPGAPVAAVDAPPPAPDSGPPLIFQMHVANHIVAASTPIRMGTEPLGTSLYRAFGVPWNPHDPNTRLKSISIPEYVAWVVAGLQGGALPRWNGSLLYPTKIPDLIGISERKYIDATGTHLNRGIGDLMRYAALVSSAETTQFGPHNVLGPDCIKPNARRSDEALYALALYLQSLKPPPNPNPVNDQSQAGQKLFAREGCTGCHVPPLYTSNKLTLARGFTPPKDIPPTLDVLRVSVGTDPGLALETRKGTGYYKVPSLKGVWYRGHYLHDGSVASLEEMFDADRLKETHKPGGYNPPGVTHRAIKGHEFGLKLTALEKQQLLAFLRTL
jgi:mono/diheme cytochrome c family protein